MISFTVTNNDNSQPISWIRIVRPSENYSIIDAGGPSWDAEVADGSVVTYRNGSIPSSASQTMSVTVQTANVQSSPETWTLQVSDESSGAGAISCSGSLTTVIEGNPPDFTPPVLHNLSFSQLTATSITISWQTDEPADSHIHYGKTEEYGDIQSDGSLVTTHRLRLTNLTPDTGYHFQAVSYDVDGNGGSLTGTFLTAVTPPDTAGNTNSGSGNSGSTSQAGPSQSTTPLAPIVPAETVPPTITMTPATIDRPTAQSPTFKGSARDNVALARVSYSVDDGRNWSLVTNVSGIGTKSAIFEFTPVIPDDGDYLVRARATDTSGNVTVTSAVKFVFDRLPPRVGNHVVALGPQVLLPSPNGALTALAGLDQRITVSAVGGPTSITLIATQVNTTTKTQPRLFSLTRSPGSGLWVGVLSLKEPGRYELRVDAIDGANNRRERLLNVVNVVQPMRIVSDASTPIASARVHIYYYDPAVQEWVVWDSSPYGQQNPVTSNKEGEVGIFLPTGTYYLTVRAKGYRSTYSQIFTIRQPSTLTDTFSIPPTPKIGIGRLRFHLPLPNPNAPSATIAGAQNSATKSKLLDQELPAFVLTTTDGTEVDRIDLRGKPTLLTFVDSWSPALNEQLPILSRLQKNKDLNIYPVSTLESRTKLETYLRLSGASVTFLTDSDGVLIESFSPQSVPTHIVVNRRGIVRKVFSGVFSDSELLRELQKVR